MGGKLKEETQQAIKEIQEIEKVEKVSQVVQEKVKQPIYKKRISKDDLIDKPKEEEVNYCKFCLNELGIETKLEKNQEKCFTCLRVLVWKE